MSGRSFGGRGSRRFGWSPRRQSWSRGIGKRKTLWVYFTGGDAKSNVLLLRP